ncbi:Gfo/Idh/MocA family protein [Granulicella sp. L60]|uniref:Gfo/Idh/MocA family protein n=1 Tax=Granulicella sp. L60 TaxID=1641866 RepID=UPI00131B1FFE|nr:Gfo/Idh/MocA family oxidoreductase [Granulicella sp. L60]
MSEDTIGRRAFLKSAAGGVLGSAGMLTGLSSAALGMEPGDPRVTYESAQPNQDAETAPKYTVKFAVCGMAHDHIYGMIGAMQRGGGVMVAAYGAEPDKIAAFKKRYPDVKMVGSEDEILNDASIQLVLSSAIANQRAPLGVRVMKHGKDYLSDKPGITTLEQLAAVRKTIAETHRIYGIMYSERLEVKAAVKAGELVHAGAIGRVIQTINIAPHQITQGHGDAGGGTGRPEWFWDPELYGGILCDIGSHQVDQFLYYTNSTEAQVVASQIANVAHPQRPKFQDFGDMMLRGDRGFGYVRLDWFTPDGLGTWGDGRLFILGTEGYIEVRKYTDVAVKKQGNNLFIVDGKQARYIDCNNLTLPFGQQFIADIVNRTHVAQDQAQCLLAAELVIKAQMHATHVTLKA